MDRLPSADDIPSIRPLMANGSNDSRRHQSIRLLSIFGNQASEVIFATVEDKVYGFGHNRYGLLGLSTDEADIRRPRLNTTLSGQQVVNIYWSYDSCFARTLTDQWYGWGLNMYGSLGVRTPTQWSTKPLLIEELSTIAVADISCGGNHTLVLDTDGRVYGWGHNKFGQLGDQSFNNVFAPKFICDSDFQSLSCGINHSAALTTRGQVYAWGINEKGQLGCHPDGERQSAHKYSVRNEPRPVRGLPDNCRQAICGPDYTMALTSDGLVYAFGFNSWGLIRGQMTGIYYTPCLLADNVRFDTIAASRLGRLAIGVSVDNVYYFWGREPSTPEYECDPNRVLTIDQMYARYSRTNKTLKTFILKELVTKAVNKTFTMTTTTTTTDVLNDDDVYDSGDESQSITTTLSDVNSLIGKPIIDRPLVCSRETTVVNQVIKTSDNNSNNSSHNKSISDNPFVSIFMDKIFSSFNSSIDSDIVFIIDGQHIHCHQTVLRLRNKMFWQKCRSVAVEVVNNNSNNNNMKTVETIDEIHITTYSYDTFYQFVRYLYGFEPEINDSNCKSLIKLGKVYDEDLLIDRCIEYLIKN
ncbi:RCC1 and BTB domain-containing protein 1-like [Oppia nitens]|uniref:RCC1 and BTB domain-containing protein 1-like n=1 Tax=Oppia nitens TaxID=1686743 RepID=UPI0023DC4C34|nr:RCC1 and BTB domain-containing protein 1-like [Oppia nitens]